MSTTEAELVSAMEAYGDVSFETYEAGTEFNHELAMRAALDAAEPLIRERIARDVEAKAADLSNVYDDFDTGIVRGLETAVFVIREGGIDS